MFLCLAHPIKSLPDLTITKQEVTATKGQLLITGANLPEGETKTVYINKILGSGQICVKDSEVTSISEFSLGCDTNDEILFNYCNTTG